MNRKGGGGGGGAGSCFEELDGGGGGFRSGNRIKSVNNLIGGNNCNNYSNIGSRSRERKVCSSSATAGGGGRILDGSTEQLNQQPQQRKLVRIIDHHLEW